MPLQAPEVATANIAAKIARLKTELEACNSQRPEFKRSSPLHGKISQLAAELGECYRSLGDFEKEYQLYESQQNYYSDNGDARGAIPWEISKSFCCEHYGRQEEALHHIEKGFQMYQAIDQDLIRLSRVENHPDQFAWAFFWYPKAGKRLCRFYMDQGRITDAMAVSSICFSAIRAEIVEHSLQYVSLESYFTNFIFWAEIAGNVHTEANKKYIAKDIYKSTLLDMERLAWDNPETMLHSAMHEHFRDVFKRKIERLGLDESDEEDSGDESDDHGSDDAKSRIPQSERFRLVSILPAPEISTPIQCTISTVNFANHPSYKALSYAWGGSRKVISYKRADGPIYGDEESSEMTANLQTILVDGVETRVRPNLFAAMQHLRQSQSPITIWIDCLCMESDDMNRRGEWAIRVRDIYGSAEEVIVWLGPGDDRSDRAMSFLKEFWARRPTLYDLGEYLFGSSTTVPWTQICDLLRRDWWKRIWTLQEFCVAGRLSVHCGNLSIPWCYLQEFTTFVDLESDIYQLPNRESDFRKLVDFVKQRHEYITLVDEFRMDGGFSLDKLFDITEHSESYDPRDKIFALIGLLDNKSAKISPKLNYRYSPCAVYTDMIVYMRVKDYANDRPLFESKKATALSEFRDHLALWPSEKTDSRCSGEACGRRLMCFTKGFPRRRMTAREIIQTSEMEYNAYREMHRMEQVFQGLNALRP